uniref:Uncharacterized protein n=1 Tax=viral metagenome TaxID=1070528 RepID=A0A6M3JKT7_9ZZZZ
MNKLKIIKNQLVKITFLDAESHPSWTYPQNYESVIKQKNRLYAYGLLLNKDKNYTCIAMGYNDEGGILNIQRIPTGSIESIKKINQPNDCETS